MLLNTGIIIDQGVSNLINYSMNHPIPHPPDYCGESIDSVYFPKEKVEWAKSRSINTKKTGWILNN